MSDPAIGYIRLSDPKQLQGGGAENQADAIKHYIKAHGMTLYKNKVFQEVYTGTTNDRPVFNALLEEIKKQKGKIKYFIIKKIDRSSRAGSKEYLEMKLTLASLGVEMRDAEGVIQPPQNRLAHRNVGYDWSTTSSSHMAEIILAEVASEDRKNILTRTVDTSITRVETGYKLREANYGYKNKRILTEDGQYKYIQEPYEPEAIFIRTIFKDSSESLLTDKEIVDKINTLGARTRLRHTYNKARTKVIGTKEGNKISVKQMQKWRQNPIYCGVINEHWGKLQKRTITSLAQYEGLISIDLFNRANKGKVFIELAPEKRVKILYDLKPEKIIKKRQKFRKDFLFKNVVLCPHCKNPFKASISKSKSKKAVPYYHCERGHKYFGVPKKEFEDNVYDFISRIRFSDLYYTKLKKFLTLEFRNKMNSLNDDHINLDEGLTKLREELKEIYNSIKKSKSPTVLDSLEKEYEEKLAEINTREEERKALRITEEDLTEFLETSKAIVEHPEDILVDVQSFEHQIAVNSLFFEELPTYTEILSGTPKLTLFFKLLSSSNDKEDVLVTLQRVELCFYP